MKAEKYIEQKATTIYSGGMNAAKVITKENALTAINLARKEKIDKIVKWLDDNAFEYVNTGTSGINIIYKGFDSEKMITDLIKAMEE